MRLFWLLLALSPYVAGPAWASTAPSAPPPPPLVSVQATDRVPWEAWIVDGAATTVLSAALWGLYSFGGSRLQTESPHAGALLTSATMAAAIFTPAAALTIWRQPEFPLDDFIATATGGVIGLGASFALTRWLGSATPLEPLSLALVLGGGQGLGSVLAYHTYRNTKPNLKNLNQLPLQRNDDPIDNWRFWRERRTP